MNLKRNISMAVLAAALAFGATPTRTVVVQVVAPSEDRAFRYQGPGLAGAIVGARTTLVVFMVNVLVNGDHARLKCYENHRGCSALGPGTYAADLDEKHGDIWISIEIPVTHRVIRDHWRVAGTW